MQNHLPKKLYILVPDNSNQIQAESASASGIISNVIKTCLGPKAMQKMVITKINSIEITNDGNSILREIDVSHPSARSIIELARTQDDEVGDGTTSVVILASEILQEMVSVLLNNHPIKVCGYLTKASEICLEVIDDLSLNLQDTEESIKKIIKSSIETKICNILQVPIDIMAYEAVKLITNDGICDLKNNVRIEKILGGNMLQSGLLEGIILNKDIIHPQMRKKIENPKIVIIDSPLEYKKGESQTSYDFKNNHDFTKALELEEKQIRNMCQYILNVNPDIVVSEKGICDLALSILHQNNITALRRLKKTDSVRLSKATGATIVNRLEDLEIKHFGDKCQLFEYIKCGEEYYSQFSKCIRPKACSVILRGPTRDILNELERNFHDASKVAKNLIMSPKLVPGGGCLEMNIIKRLKEIETSNALEKEVYEKLADALTVIPTILLTNSGVFNPLMKIGTLEEEIIKNAYAGVNGVTGEIEDMRNVILEPLAVKKQIYVSAIQAVLQLLRVDGIMESKSANNMPFPMHQQYQTPILRSTDRLLPVANIGKIMKRPVPKEAKIAKEAKEIMQKSASEFIAIVTCKAREICEAEARKTVTGDDLIRAMEDLDMPLYADLGKKYFIQYKNLMQSDRKQKTPRTSFEYMDFN